MSRLLTLGTAAAIAATALCGCTQSVQHLGAGYGHALREDAVAQIADPDAKYRGDPTPASNGTRAATAQSRYEKGQVTPPAATSTSSVGGGGGGGNQ